MFVQWLPAKLGMVRPSGDEDEEEEENRHVASLEELQVGFGRVTDYPRSLTTRLKVAIYFGHTFTVVQFLLL